MRIASGSFSHFKLRIITIHVYCRLDTKSYLFTLLPGAIELPEYTECFKPISQNVASSTVKLNETNSPLTMSSHSAKTMQLELW